MTVCTGFGWNRVNFTVASTLLCFEKSGDNTGIF